MSDIHDTKNLAVNGSELGLASMRADTDRDLGRAGHRSIRYIRVALEADVAPPRQQRPPIAVAFALDRSGSMGSGKMELARAAVITALQRLEPTDRFAISVFDDRVDVVAEAGPATPKAIERARRALERIEPRGSTALYDGWHAAARQLTRQPDAKGVARCVVVTDGQANVGPSAPESLAEAARELRRRGVVTTTLGIGADFQEEVLGVMSRAGGGQFYYVQRAEQLDAVLEAEIGEAMEVIAHGVRLQLCPSPGVRLRLMSDYPSAWTGTHLAVEVGDLISGQQLELLVGARLPAAATGETASVEVCVTDADGPIELPIQTVRWQLAPGRANDSQPRNPTVTRLAAEVIAAHALLGTLGFNRMGDFDAVRHRLDEAIAKVRGLGDSDPEVDRHVRALLEARERLTRRVDEHELKAHYFAGTSASRSKRPDGRARR